LKCVVILETLFGFYFTHTIQTSVLVVCTMYLPCSSYGSSLCGLHNLCIFSICYQSTVLNLLISMIYTDNKIISQDFLDFISADTSNHGHLLS
jgi:hypothetical protein